MISSFTILSAIVQGVLEPGRIDGPYALDVTVSSGHSPSRSSPTARLCETQTQGGE